MCDNKFLTNHMPTIGKFLLTNLEKIGIDFKLKNIEIDNKKIKL